MINDTKKIQELTGYDLGDLYLQDKMIPFGNKKSTIFDENSGNFHLYPANIETMRENCRIISNIRKEMIKKMKNDYGHEILSKAEFNKKQEDSKIYLYPGYGSRGGIRTLRCAEYSENKANCLYKYIVCKRNNQYYILNFMRFFIKDGKVNCVLQQIQFEKICSDFSKKNNINVNYSIKNKSIEVCYPIMDENGIEKKNVNDDGNFVWTPSPIIPLKEENISIILNTFDDFIKNN